MISKSVNRGLGTIQDYEEEIHFYRRILRDCQSNSKFKPTISVIIPTLNEEKNLPLVLPFLPMNWIDEVILVDGRSTDNTVEVAKKILPSIKVILEPRKGKGIAMSSGYKASKGDIIIVIDADGSNDPREIPRFVTALLEGADFAKGSRFAPGGGTTDMPAYRKLGNGFFVSLSNLLFNTNFTDLCYGYHAFWRCCLDAIETESFNGFEIDTALYLQAVRKRFRIVDIPSFEGYRFYGMGKLQTIPDGLRVLKTIIGQWRAMLMEHEDTLHLGFRGIHYARPEVFNKDYQAQRKVQVMHRLFNLILLLGVMSLNDEDTDSIIQRVIKLTMEAVGAESGSLVLLDENGKLGHGYLVSTTFLQKPYSPDWDEILNRGVAGWSIRNRQPVLILDTDDDPRWLSRPWEKTQRSAVSLPLNMGGVVIGALTLVRPIDKQFTYSELKTLISYQNSGILETGL